MDPTSLIFVALAIAWAVYLVPKAVKHHDEVVRSRSVDLFSATMRVLARREPVNRRNARLVVTPGRGAQAPIVTRKPASAAADPESGPVAAAPSRAAVQRATRRRRRVLGLILFSLLAVAGVAAFGLISWAYVAIPASLLVAWLVACRVMVKSERRTCFPLAEGQPPDCSGRHLRGIGRRVTHDRKDRTIKGLSQHAVTVME